MSFITNSVSTIHCNHRSKLIANPNTDKPQVQQPRVFVPPQLVFSVRAWVGGYKHERSRDRSTRCILANPIAHLTLHAAGPADGVPNESSDRILETRLATQHIKVNSEVKHQLTSINWVYASAVPGQDLRLGLCGFWVRLTSHCFSTQLTDNST